MAQSYTIKSGASIALPLTYRNNVGAAINVSADTITSSMVHGDTKIPFTVDMTNAAAGQVILRYTGTPLTPNVYSCDVKRVSSGTVSYSETFKIVIGRAETE